MFFPSLGRADRPRKTVTFIGRKRGVSRSACVLQYLYPTCPGAPFIQFIPSSVAALPAPPLTTMTMMNLDSSLDDMIKAAPRQRRGGGGGKKGGGKKGGGEKVVPKPKPGKNAGGVRQKVIAKPRRGPSGGRSVTAMAVDAMDTWQHDMFQDGGRGPRGGGRGPQGGAKLIISNLHFNVSNQDIKASERLPRVD